ncbi:diguanylate cyclase [Sporomusa sp.]|uniref:diguanylate cyclase n=1 Tax=Sporomusa sp. TaxID=2078658 RepID=UPI002C3DDC4A|nr:HD domain-containing phosphohydrolase [Sporomusa sp.]HWR42574.1 HD domain-containing phosphohydrolase [Sporomusa sp.]
MPLREKSIIIIGLTLFLLLFSIFLTADTILVNGYQQLEKSDTERNVKRAIKGVENEVASLESIVRDWAQWDDSYHFIESGSQEFIDANFVDLTFISQRINVIMYTDLDGRIVYARAFDWDKREDAPLTDEVAAKLAAVKPKPNSTPFSGINKGVLNLREGQMLIAAGAISDSTGSAPSRGVLLIGRYVTYVEKEKISECVQLPIDFGSWDGDLPADFVAAQDYLSYRDEVYVNPVDKNYMAGYAVLPDIFGQPALLMRVLVAREISHQGQQTLNYFIAMLLVAGLIFGIVMLTLIERKVLSRLTQLNGIVEKITRSKDLSIRLPVAGRDELTELATNINNMLGSLEKAQTRLRYVGRHDTLTGLYNRAFFEECIAKTKESVDSVQVLVADVDGLKLINDTLGHTSGDALLRKAAEVLQQTCPHDAIIARFGGDEFAIILKNYPAKDVAQLCKEIKEAVASANHETPGLTLSMSIGYATGTHQSSDAGELLKEADNYMYRDKLFHNRSTRSAIVQTLKKALEVRDFITDGHADRMQDLVRLLGTEIGFSENRLSELQLFAQFHDIGKVGIPDGILFKPGRLTAEETAIMRSHSEIGYRIARAAPDLVFIADWVLKHHEWWNGGGYPLGLKAEDIPIECRILALADAYDAMTNQRPYRTPLTQADAIEEIRRNAGVQFDPELTEVFITILPKLQ